MIKHFILFVMTLLLLSSCVSEYGVAHRNYPLAKLTVPYANGKDTSASYIGAAYSYGSAALGFPTTFAVRAPEDHHYSFQLSAHYGKQSENIYHAIGLMAYKGVYELKSFPMEELVGPLDFWGVGATYEIGLFLPLGDFILRPIGAKITGLLEPGEYANFRSTYLDISNNYRHLRNGNPDNFLYNISTVYGGSYHTGDWKYSLDIIMGISEEDLASAANLYISYKKFTLTMNSTYEPLKGRYAISGGFLYQF